MFSSKVRAAFRAVVGLARAGAGPGARPVRVEKLARACHVSAPYLAKIVAEMAAAGVAATVKGPGGGVRLSRPPEAITLADVAGAVEKAPGGPRMCVLEDVPCREMLSCPLHRVCHAVRVEILGRATVAEAARAYEMCLVQS